VGDKGLAGCADYRAHPESTNELAWIERETDELRSALLASIQATGARCRIDYIPGCAELGDLTPRQRRLP
jgi:hypothetical protein